MNNEYYTIQCQYCKQIKSPPDKMEWYNEPVIASLIQQNRVKVLVGCCENCWKEERKKGSDRLRNI